MGQLVISFILVDFVFLFSVAARFTQSRIILGASRFGLFGAEAVRHGLCRRRHHLLVVFGVAGVPELEEQIRDFFFLRAKNSTTAVSRPPPAVVASRLSAGWSSTRT